MKTPPKPKPQLLPYSCVPLLILLLLAFRNAPTSAAFVAFSVAMGLAFTAAPTLLVRVVIFKSIFIINPVFCLFVLGGMIGREIFFGQSVGERFESWIVAQYLCLVALSCFLSHFFLRLRRKRETDGATQS